MWEAQITCIEAQNNKLQLPSLIQACPKAPPNLSSGATSEDPAGPLRTSRGTQSWLLKKEHGIVFPVELPGPCALVWAPPHPHGAPARNVGWAQGGALPTPHEVGKCLCLVPLGPTCMRREFTRPLYRVLGQISKLSGLGAVGRVSTIWKMSLCWSE